jgi:peptidoglycan/xylan/chitin deacetylase (PgdA/CDA1 family)
MPLFRIPRIVRYLLPHATWDVSSSHAIYLTFDDGPSSEGTDWILDELEKYGFKATFFCTGTHAQQFPEKMISLREKGHGIGNHSMRHENGWKTKSDVYIKSVEDTIPFTSSLFRPPYGKLTWRQYRKLRKKTRIVMWSWMAYDFDARLPVSKIILSLKKNLYPGAILVFHDNPSSFERLKEILPVALKLIKEQGLTTAVLSA